MDSESKGLANEKIKEIIELGKNFGFNDMDVDIYNSEGESYVNVKAHIKNIQSEDGGLQRCIENNDGGQVLHNSLLGCFDLLVTSQNMEKFLQVKQILSQSLNHPNALNILNNLDLALNIDKRNADSLKLAFMMKLSTQGECTGLMQVFKDIVLTPSSTANKFLPSSYDWEEQPESTFFSCQ